MSSLRLVKGQDSSRRGREFEKEVVDVFQRNGYVLLKKNYWMKNFDLTIDDALKREFDIVMFSIKEAKPYIIECKAHLDSSTYVGLDLIREFDSKLNSYLGSGAASLMVTDNDFTKPVYEYASKSRIHLLNGRGFDEFARRGSLGSKITSSVTGGIFTGVCKVAKEVVNEYLL